MQFELQGFSELGEALKQFPEVLAKKYLARAVSSAAAVIRVDAASRAPVRTGNLRNAISIFRVGVTPVSAEYAVGVKGIKLNRNTKKLLRLLRKANGGKTMFKIDGDQYYWRFIEFGTSKMAARPFLRPAFEAQKGNALEVMRVVLADGVVAAASEVSRL